MSLFFKPSGKELLELRNKIFLERGVPALNKNGFMQSPFTTAWFGRNNLQEFTYELCRLADDSVLEKIVVHISRGDKWIKIFLNIFQLTPAVGSLDQLKGVDGLKYGVPPNSHTEMRLRSDDIRGIPLFNYSFWFKNHRIKSYCTKKGLSRRTDQLGKLIENDLGNIDHFIKRWHELHKINKTDWQGTTFPDKST